MSVIVIQTNPPLWWRHPWIAAAIRFAILGVVCGMLYGWATQRFYPTDRPAGFGHGMIHGALMPMALPSLVMGKNVVIYAPNNTGRTYKLGYTVGINICGVIFFGFGFGGIGRKVEILTPVPAPTPSKSSSEISQ